VEERIAAGMVNALTIRQPDHRDLSWWIERSLTLAREGSDVNRRLQACTVAANCFIWTGKLGAAEALREEAKGHLRAADVAPLTVINWSFMEIVLDLLAGSPLQTVLGKLRETKNMADETGIVIWNAMLSGLGVYASILDGDLAAAGHFLDLLRAGLGDGQKHLHCFSSYLASWLSILKGADAVADGQAQAALKIAEETGYRFPEILCLLAAAHTRRVAGEDAEADQLLARARLLSGQSGSDIFRFACLLEEASAAFAGLREEAGVQLLSEALTLGRKQGYGGLLWWWRPEIMSGLCARALEERIEPEYVRDLILRRGLRPPSAGLALDTWPYPVKIRTLGNFRIEKDDMPLAIEDKVRQKPLVMLKLLIALGGQDVSGQQLSDILWPESDGDLAHKSHEMTLLRLRKFLGVEGAVQLKGGLVSLDQRYCWVDVWAIEEILQKATERWRSLSENGARPEQETVEAIRLTEQATALYGGPFLKGDLEQAWTIPMRERVRSRLLHVLISLTRHRELEHRWEEALACIEKGLVIDPLMEEFYRHQMICHESLGRRSEALRAYERCNAVLSSSLGIAPANETRTVYQRVRGVG
jgi:DNA-binding SARP family transcriptional activator